MACLYITRTVSERFVQTFRPDGTAASHEPKWQRLDSPEVCAYTTDWSNRFAAVLPQYFGVSVVGVDRVDADLLSVAPPGAVATYCLGDEGLLDPRGLSKQRFGGRLSPSVT